MHLFRDRNEVAAINAYYKMGKTDYLDGNMNITALPLEMVNPFIPDKMAKLTGALQGELAITGTTSAPAVNGYGQLGGICHGSRFFLPFRQAGYQDQE